MTLAGQPVGRALWMATTDMVTSPLHGFECFAPVWNVLMCLDTSVRYAVYISLRLLLLSYELELSFNLFEQEHRLGHGDK